MKLKTIFNYTSTPIAIKKTTRARTSDQHTAVRVRSIEWSVTSAGVGHIVIAPSDARKIPRRW